MRTSALYRSRAQAAARWSEHAAERGDVERAEGFSMLAADWSFRAADAYARDVRRLLLAAAICAALGGAAWAAGVIG